MLLHILYISHNKYSFTVIYELIDQIYIFNNKLIFWDSGMRLFINSFILQYDYGFVIRSITFRISLYASFSIESTQKNQNLNQISDNETQKYNTVP